MASVRVRAAYILGPGATNVCPSNYYKILNEPECIAGASSGLRNLLYDVTYYRKENNAHDPSGCYVFSTGQAIFNEHPIGAAGGTYYQPLCSCAPRPTAPRRQPASHTPAPRSVVARLRSGVRLRGASRAFARCGRGTCRNRIGCTPQHVAARCNEA